MTVKVVSLLSDYGDRVSFLERLRLPHLARNPGAFDYQAFLIQQDIDATLFVRKAEQVVAVQSLPGYWLDEGLVLPMWRAVRETIERNLDGAPARLSLGLLLGEKRRIPEKVRDAFRGTGLAQTPVAMASSPI